MLVSYVFSKIYRSWNFALLTENACDLSSLPYVGLMICDPLWVGCYRTDCRVGTLAVVQSYARVYYNDS